MEQYNIKITIPFLDKVGTIILSNYFFSFPVQLIIKQIEIYYFEHLLKSKSTTSTMIKLLDIQNFKWNIFLYSQVERMLIQMYPHVNQKSSNTLYL